MSLSLAIALGCSGGSMSEHIPTFAGYKARLDLLTGKSISIAFAELGAPTRTVDIPGGSKLYVWEEKSELRTPITGEERHNSQTHSDQIVLHPSQRVPLDCFTELETDAAGIVVRSRTEGIACVAKPPGPGFAQSTASPVAAAPPASTLPPVPAPTTLPSPSGDPTATAGASAVPVAAGAVAAAPEAEAAEASEPVTAPERRVRRPGGAKAQPARPRIDRSK
ncbi:MAG: hypothetical protein Q8P41_29220 [Pseudomonadota bacterium]|nr:hypothetical protein [Pseudomonadota bacterium]